MSVSVFVVGFCLFVFEGGGGGRTDVDDETEVAAIVLFGGEEFFEHKVECL